MTGTSLDSIFLIQAQGSFSATRMFSEGKTAADNVRCIRCGYDYCGCWR